MAHAYSLSWLELSVKVSSCLVQFAEQALGDHFTVVSLTEPWSHANIGLSAYIVLAVNTALSHVAGVVGVAHLH